MNEWLGGRWYVTLYFVSIVSFGYATPGNTTEVWKLKNISNGHLKVKIKGEDRYIRGRVVY